MSVFEETAKINRRLAGLVAVAGALAWSQPAVAGSDLWWHLASGRDIWSHMAIRSSDPFSYTFGGRIWMNHEWLWDVIYWGVYHFVQPQAVAWLNLGVVAAIFAMTFTLARRESGSALAAGLMLWGTAASAHWFLDIRPHLWTLLLVNLFLLTRKHRFAPWIWPVMMALWANLHSGFVFGVGLIGLFVLVDTIETSLREGRLVIARGKWLGVFACMLVVTANPWGYAILRYPFDYLNPDSPFRQIIEWRPPHFAFGLIDFHGRYTLVAVLAMLGVPLALRRKRFLLALAIVTFSMAYTSRRFIPLFAITSAPIGALAIAWVRQRLVRRAPWLNRADLGFTCTAGAAVLSLFLWHDVRIYPHLLERWTQASLYPDAALRYLRAMGSPTRLLNYYNWGGYIMLHAQEFRVFIDGRANTLYDDAIYLDYMAMLSGQPGTRVRAARYPADAALVPTGSALGRALRQGRNAWTVVYSDPVALILLPPGSPWLRRPLPKPGRALQDLPDFDLNLSREALRKGQIDRAERLARQAIELDPLRLRAYGQLVNVLLRTEDSTKIDQAIEAGLRAAPRTASYLERTRGQAYESLYALHLAQGRVEQARTDLRQAMAAFRRAVPTGPFSNPDPLRQKIRSLEKKWHNAATRMSGGSLQ